MSGLWDEKMIKKLQIKIIGVITLLLSIVIFIVMFGINFMIQSENNKTIQKRMNNIAESNGMKASSYITPFGDNDTSYIDNFSVLLTDDNEVITISFNRDIVVLQNDILAYANQALASKQETGFLGHYAYMVKSRPYGKIIVFLDVSVVLNQQENLIVTTSIIGVIAVIIFFLIALGLSFWLVRPVKETLNKQKLFISNASHELKTPLAVISANADVLSAEIGENKWLSYIQKESIRMAELVNELLSLARLDDKASNKLIKSEFCLTDILLQTALPFESRMFEMGKKFEVDAEEDIFYTGDQSAIKHIISILIDNAVKYSDEHGEISVKLFLQNNKRVLEVYNTGIGIKKEKLEKIFERFYREDEARNSKSGGYGLGLAIAKETVKAHGGRIYAESEYQKWAKFTVIL